MSYPVAALLTGQAAPFRGDEHSAIVKSPVSGPVAFTRLGLTGDQQADRTHHGGPDMAVHHYPLDHHDHWRTELGGHPLLDDPGAFGSNLAVRGLTEGAVHIGDRFRIGGALLEISQPRQPCWKIEHHFQHKGMVAKILRTGHCGWYYRVIEEGTAQAGDALVREVAGDPIGRVDRVFSALWGDPKAAPDEYLRSLTSLEQLTRKLREKVAARLS